MARNHFARIGAKLFSGCVTALLASPLTAAAQSEEANRALARRFYEEVWFSRNLAAVDELVAPDYVVHDIGERKALRESAIEQKDIAEFFWNNGAMSGHIDFQLADGDLVATRWQWQYQPRTWLMTLSMIGSRNPIPIINVFRFKDGKIVEIWNHRHDIDIGFASILLRAQGFVAGFAVVGGGGVRPSYSAVASPGSFTHSRRRGLTRSCGAGGGLDVRSVPKGAL